LVKLNLQEQRRYLLGKKPMVSALPLNNNLWLGEKSPSLSLGVYYNSIMVDKNIRYPLCEWY